MEEIRERRNRNSEVNEISTESKPEKREIERKREKRRRRTKCIILMMIELYGEREIVDFNVKRWPAEMPLIVVSLNTIGEDATIYIYVMFNDKRTTSLWTVVFHP